VSPRPSYVRCNLNAIQKTVGRKPLGEALVNPSQNAAFVLDLSPVSDALNGLGIAHEIQAPDDIHRRDSPKKRYVDGRKYNPEAQEVVHSLTIKILLLPRPEMHERAGRSQIDLTLSDDAARVTMTAFHAGGRSIGAAHFDVPDCAEQLVDAIAATALGLSAARQHVALPRKARDEEASVASFDPMRLKVEKKDLFPSHTEDLSKMVRVSTSAQPHSPTNEGQGDNIKSVLCRIERAGFGGLGKFKPHAEVVVQEHYEQGKRDTPAWCEVHVTTKPGLWKPEYRSPTQNFLTSERARDFAHYLVKALAHQIAAT
jgi:hypothetical protein